MISETLQLWIESQTCNPCCCSSSSGWPIPAILTTLPPPRPSRVPSSSTTTTTITNLVSLFSTYSKHILVMWSIVRVKPYNTQYNTTPHHEGLHGWWTSKYLKINLGFVQFPS
jgi:hypothetical protein